MRRYFFQLSFPSPCKDIDPEAMACVVMAQSEERARETLPGLPAVRDNRVWVLFKEEKVPE